MRNNPASRLLIPSLAILFILSTKVSTAQPKDDKILGEVCAKALICRVVGSDPMASPVCVYESATCDGTSSGVQTVTLAECGQEICASPACADPDNDCCDWGASAGDIRAVPVPVGTSGTQQHIISPDTKKFRGPVDERNIRFEEPRDYDSAYRRLVDGEEVRYFKLFWNTKKNIGIAIEITQQPTTTFDLPPITAHRDNISDVSVEWDPRLPGNEFFTVIWGELP